MGVGDNIVEEAVVAFKDIACPVDESDLWGCSFRDSPEREVILFHPEPI